MSPDYIKGAYRRLLEQVGQPILIRRYTGTGPNRPHWDVQVWARVVDYNQKEMVGSIAEGDRRVIVLAEDLIAASFTLPIRKGDKVVVRGKEMNIEAHDDSTRRVQGEIIAYELQVRG